MSRTRSLARSVVAPVAVAAVVALSVLASAADRAPVAPTPPPSQMTRVSFLSCASEDVASLRYCDPTNATAPCQTIRASCFPYKCDAGEKTCAAACTSNAQCAADAECKAGRCRLARPHCDAERRYSFAVDGTKTDCWPYRCDAALGACVLKFCGTVNDCIPGTACNAQGRCVGP